MTQITVEYPHHSGYGEMMKGYFSLMRGFGHEVWQRCNVELSQSVGPTWWSDLRRKRKDENDKVWKGAVNKHDPSILLAEYLWRAESPIRSVLSDSERSKVLATKIRDTRNSWVHFTVEPGPAELQAVAEFVKEFASINGLKIASPAAAMARRAQRIRSGQYQPYADVIQDWRSQNQITDIPAQGAEPALPAAASDELPLPDTEVIEVESSMIEDRPAIGARWSGDIPAVRFVESRIGDLVDPSTGDGLRSRVGAEQWARKRRLWLAPRPLGGVWVDERDGAVGGFVDNVPRLLGYLGDEPDDGLARGFLTAHYYEAADGRIVDLDSGQALQDAVPADRRPQAAQLEAVVLAAVPDRAGLRLSTYGDLVAITDDGAERVAVIEPEQWFPGHLA
jgi:hypothetical protein